MLPRHLACANAALLFAGIPFAGILFAGIAEAQLPALFTVAGDAAGDWFGYSVSHAGDVNADGVPDFIVGAHQNQNGGHSPYPGYARVYSGVDGSELYTFLGDGTNPIDGPDDHFGCAVSWIGDLNADGHDEVFVGAYKDDNNGFFNSGMIRIFSGADGSVMHQDDGVGEGKRMGYSIDGAGDVTGDGVPDYVVSVYKDDNTFFNAGSVRLHSGADHSRLFTFDGSSVYALFGWSCKAVGDTDGDGVGDYVAGAPTDSSIAPNAGSGWLYSGADGTELHHWHGEAAEDYFGHSVSGAGDVNGDGLEDLAVGAIQSTLLGATTGPGYVRVFSGADGSLLFELTGDDSLDQFGFAIDGVGDLNADGYDDLLIGAPRGVTLGHAPTGLPGYARLFSGRDGSILCGFTGDFPDDQFGVSLERIGDLDLDGLGEFIVGACHDVLGQTESGYAKVFSGALFVAERHCVAAPNSAGPGALIDHRGTFSISRNDLELLARDCPPLHFGLFYCGPNQIQLPFGDGYRCIGGQTMRLGMAGSGSSGVAELALDFSDPSSHESNITPGSRWSFQFWYRDVPAGMSGFNLTDAIAASFSP